MEIDTLQQKFREFQFLKESGIPKFSLNEKYPDILYRYCVESYW